VFRLISDFSDKTTPKSLDPGKNVIHCMFFHCFKSFLHFFIKIFIKIIQCMTFFPGSKLLGVVLSEKSDMIIINKL
jgi:hypothetical protein